MKENVKFQVKIGVMDMYRFLLGYNYKSFGGIFGVIISVACLGLLAVGYKDNSLQTNGVLLAIGLLFTVVQPILIWKKAATQIVKNPLFKNPIEYEVNQEGFTIRQKEEEAPLLWESILRVVETKKQLLVYTSRVNACILPKDQMAEQWESVKETIANHLENNQCNWKK